MKWEIFSQKFYPEFFYEYFIEGIEPPFHPSKCHIWGGYGRGEGVYNTITPHANSEGREWFRNNFNLKKDPPIFESVIYISYLCIDGERSMSGSGGITFAEGRLPRAWSVRTLQPTLIYYWIIKKFPTY